MLFEVSRGGQGLMHTESVKCIPDRAQLLDMQREGYKFRLDGKAVNAAQICAVIAESKKGG